MKHEDVWRALDTLAAESGLSVSGLARRAGLDPTAFNPSKRRTAEGKPRWPGTESLAKVLLATGADMHDFAALLTGMRVLPRDRMADRIADRMPDHERTNRPLLRRIPLIGLAQAGADGYFDDGGYPAGAGWDEIALPEVGDPHAYALQISGRSMEPVFREGNVVIVSPAAPVRQNDRVVVRTQRGEVMAKELLRRSANRVELRSLNPEFANRVFDMAALAWMHRILWASQ